MNLSLSRQPKRLLRPGRWSPVLLSVVAFLVISASLAYSQVGGSFNLTWATVDGGGGTFSTGGHFSLGGTAGQPDAGTSSGGSFTMKGGFWGRSVVAPNLTPTPPATNTPVPTQVPLLVGHVTWQGRPAQPNSLQRLPVTLTLKVSTREYNYPSQTTDPSGFFTVSLAGVSAATYNWRVKGPDGTLKTLTTDPPGFLAITGMVTLAGTPQTNVEMGLMRAGDANNDNLESITDFNILKVSFGTSMGGPGYDNRADFNGDALISIGDFNLLKQNFGTGGQPPVGPGR